MSTPFYIVVKKKRGMSIRNCVKSMEFRPINFQKQHLATTDFSDKTCIELQITKLSIFKKTL